MRETTKNYQAKDWHLNEPLNRYYVSGGVPSLGILLSTHFSTFYISQHYNVFCFWIVLQFTLFFAHPGWHFWGAQISWETCSCELPYPPNCCPLYHRPQSIIARNAQFWRGMRNPHAGPSCILLSNARGLSASKARNRLRELCCVIFPRRRLCSLRSLLKVLTRVSRKSWNFWIVSTRTASTLLGN